MHERSKAAATQQTTTQPRQSAAIGSFRRLGFSERPRFPFVCVRFQFVFGSYHASAQHAEARIHCMANHVSFETQRRRYLLFFVFTVSSVLSAITVQRALRVFLANPRFCLAYAQLSSELHFFEQFGTNRTRPSHSRLFTVLVR